MKNLIIERGSPLSPLRSCRSFPGQAAFEGLPWLALALILTGGSFLILPTSLFAAAPTAELTEAAPFLANDLQTESALSILDVLTRRRQQLDESSWHLVYRLDEQRLADMEQIRLETGPASALAVIRHCPVGPTSGACTRTKTSLLFFNPATGSLQKGYFGLHLDAPSRPLRVSGDVAGAMLTATASVPMGRPFLVEVLDGRLFWALGDIESGSGALLDSASGEMLDPASFADLLGEEVREAAVQQGGTWPPAYPAVSFPTLDAVTTEQEMHQDQSELTPPGYAPGGAGQVEPRLCGPSSLTQVFDYHGEHVPLWKIADVSTANQLLPGNNGGTYYSNLQRAVSFSHTSVDFLRTIGTDDRTGAKEWGFIERQEQLPDWLPGTKHYGYVSCRAQWFDSYSSDQVLDAYDRLVEMGQPPIVYLAQNPTCPGIRHGTLPGEADCNDGVDNDLDGLTDGQDPDCGEINCADGVDNDGDGKTDGADPDCGERLCADGIDNDVDGKTDCEDPDCIVPQCFLNYTWTGGHYVVIMGVYDAPPADQLVVTLDPGIATDFYVRNWAAHENGPYCGDTRAEYYPNFHDHIVAGGNGILVARPMPVQLALLENQPSPGRFTIQAQTYTRPIEPNIGGGVTLPWVQCNLSRPLNGCLLESGDGACSNGIDDDADGLTDCADPDCYLNPIVTACTAPQQQENSDVECTDGSDNDGDGMTDCQDSGCSNNYFVTKCGVPATRRENRDDTCTDGVDNDGDGLIDSADPDCHNPFITSATIGPFCGSAPWTGSQWVPISLYRDGSLAGLDFVPWNADSRSMQKTSTWSFTRDGSEIGAEFRVVVVGNLYGAKAGYQGNGYFQEDRLWYDQVYGWASFRMDAHKMVFKIGGVGVAAFGDEGNLYLKGNLHLFAGVQDPLAQEVVFHDGSGLLVAKIDQWGDMWTMGFVHQNMNDINDTTHNGTTEQVYINSQPPQVPDAGRTQQQTLRVDVPATSVRLDTYGNLMLRGIVFENYSGL